MPEIRPQLPRNRSRGPSGRKGGALLALVALVAVLGCSADYTTEPLDLAAAEKALETALKAWQQGKPIDSLAKETPPITVLDIDWSSGQKLASFEMAGDSRKVDGRLMRSVKLTLKDDRESAVESLVTYVVTTSPGLVVMRDLPR